MQALSSLLGSPGPAYQVFSIIDQAFEKFPLHQNVLKTNYSGWKLENYNNGNLTVKEY